MESLYSRIQKLAKKQGISVRKLEETLGMSNGTIRHWSTCNPGVYTLLDVSKYLGCSLDYLVGNDDTEPLSKQQLELLQMMEELNDDGMRALKGALTGLVAMPEYKKSNNLQTKREYA